MTSTLARNIKKRKFDEESYTVSFSAYVEKLIVGVGKLKKEMVYKSTVEFRNLDSITEEGDIEAALVKAMET